MNRYVIGLDNGGTVTKAAIFDLKGSEISRFSLPTQVITPKPGYVERDMAELWQTNGACIRGAMDKARIDSRSVIGVAVAGHGKGLYPWGQDGRPVGHGILSTDNRAWAYPEKWYREGTAQALYPQLCQKIMACQQVALLAWMKDHDRAAYDRIQWIFSVKDYIRFRMTGEAYSEATDISGSGLMDIRNCRFDQALLEQLGIGEVFNKLAPICYSYEHCGSITAEAARLTGLKEGTPVAGGMFDIDSCAIAMDVTTPEDLCLIAGTWSINEYIATEPVLDGSIDMNSLFAIPGYYLVEECSATSAGNLDWFLQKLMADYPVAAGRRLYDVVDELVDKVDPAASDVYFLPFLYGSNSHPLGKSAFVGLTLYHDLPHLLRAVYEGVAYSHKTHVDKLLLSRKAPRAIRMAGGAANSPVWVQLFADVLNLPIETVCVKELGALGAAMAAAVAAGEFTDYRQAAKAMVRVQGQVEPDPDKADLYQRKYNKYSAIRQALDEMWGLFEV